MSFAASSTLRTGDSGLPPAAPGRPQPRRASRRASGGRGPRRNDARPSVTISDREFLPAAMEIIETPPSPLHMAFMLTICGLLLTTIAWLCIATFEIHAVAIGKVQPNGRTKIVQPAEPGRVIAVKVENGSIVRAGDILIELDPTVPAADRAAIERTLHSVAAEIAARRSLLVWVRSDAHASWPGQGGAETNEAKLIIAEAERLRTTLDNIAAQRTEAEARRKRLAASIDARTKLIALLKERVDTREALDQRGQGYRAKVIDALESFQRETAVLIGDQGQLAEVDAQLLTLGSKQREHIAHFIADQSRLLLEAERKRDQTAQDLVKARSRDERMELRAPVSGVVQQLAVSTLGQVVQSGEALLSIVPLDAPIEVEAMVANKDIGFVEPAQPVVVKIDAFPFTRYGTISGRLTKVSRDAVDPRAPSVATEASTALRGGTNATGAPQSLVFPVTVALDRTMITAGKNEIPLVAGMSVVVVIKTGERRAIDFFLSFVSEVISSSAKER